MTWDDPPELPRWLRPLVPFRRYVVPAAGHRVHVMEAGRGRPVLLLHGNPTWSFLYRKVAARLYGAPLRLVMPDLVGLGLSDKPTDPGFHTLDGHATVLGALVDALDLQDLVFVGQDWGGPIGGLALARRPGRMTGAVVLNTVLAPPKPGFTPTAFHRFSRMPVVSDVVFRGLGFPQLDLSVAQRDPLRGSVARAYRWPLRSFADRVAPLALARMVPDTMEHPSVPPLGEVRDFIEGFRGPAAIVWGTGDPVLGRLADRTARMLPEARVQKLEAGHFIQEEEPAAIADAIRMVAGL